LGFPFLSSLVRYDPSYSFTFELAGLPNFPPRSRGRLRVAQQIFVLELVCYTVYVIGAFVFPFGSSLLLLLNLPLLVYNWRLVFIGRFFFSPFQIVRNATRHDLISVIHVIVFLLNTPFVLWKLFASAFLRPVKLPI
jgi:hypothetical protein